MSRHGRVPPDDLIPLEGGPRIRVFWPHLGTLTKVEEGRVGPGLLRERLEDLYESVEWIDFDPREGPEATSLAPTQDLTLFFTGDHSGRVVSCGCPREDYGGVTRRAAFLDTLRTRGWEFVSVEAGGFVPFEGEQHGFRKAENIIRAQEAELYFYSQVLGFPLPDDIEPVTIVNLPTP